MDLNTYEVFVLRSDETKYDLTNIVTSLSWEESENDLVAKANITFANKYHTLTDSWTGDIVPLGAFIFIYANGEEVFLGPIWEHSYSAGNEEVSITACDYMVYLSQSSDSFFYTSGQSTDTIVKELCDRWTVTVNYDYDTYTHGQIAARNKTLLDQLTEIMDECETNSSGPGYVAQFVENELYIREKGYNDTIYTLTNQSDESGCLMSLEMSSDLNNLVTRVTVFGTSDEEGQEPIEATVEGDTSYGILQQTVYRDSDTTLEDAKAEAQKIIDENGKPELSFSVSAPDIPSLRKGHKVRCIFSDQIDGYYYVMAVSHEADDQSMSLTLEEVED